MNIRNIFNSKTAEAVEKAKQPINRLFDGGWQQMGAITRGTDTRTASELKHTIDAYVQRIPEIATFADDIKKLNPKHMGTIADTIELSQYHEMLPTNIDLKKVGSGGVSYRDAIIKDMVEASKTNPEAMELVDAIINNTDSITAKYALAEMSGGILKNKDVAKHMQETAKVVPDIAKETLGGGYLMDYSKQENFMTWIKEMVNPDTKPDKITGIFKDLIPLTENLPQTFIINVNKYLISGAPKEKLAENYKVLPDVVKMLDGKAEKIDVVDFVTKNTNLY